MDLDEYHDGARDSAFWLAFSRQHDSDSCGLVWLRIWRLIQRGGRRVLNGLGCVEKSEARKENVSSNENRLLVTYHGNFVKFTYRRQKIYGRSSHPTPAVR
jgi:hypothetical protein